MNWRETLVFPPEVPISVDAHSLVTSLCSDATVRPATFGDIKEHPFFRGVDWEHIRDRPAAIPIRVRQRERNDVISAAVGWARDQLYWKAQT